MAGMDREPCPWRVVEDAGGAFVFGLGGGTIWHTFGGLRNAPKGHRLEQTVARVKARVPILGGSFAIWGTLFSLFDCSFTYIRKKEDPWNAIFSGAATGGLLAARAGIKAAGKNALVGGVILAAIEGLNIVVTRALMPMLEEKQAAAGMVVDTLEPPVDPLRPRIGKSTPLWQPTYTAPSPQASASGGFDMDSISQFGGQDQWQQQQEQAKQAEPESKPFWKIW